MESSKYHTFSPSLLLFISLTVLASITACSQQKNNKTNSGSEKARVNVQTIASGLDHPWGIAFLPDKRLLITERSGALRILHTNNQLSDPIEGVPEVYNSGQGGLLDVALDPDFANNKYVYLSFSEPRANGASTSALGRGTLQNDRISNFTVIFRQEPAIRDDKHYGGRIVFSPDGHIFFTMGERFQFQPAQDLSNHLGTVVRIHSDGSVPEDNPFVRQQGAREEIWSYGHRNIEAAVIHPDTRDLWVVEMGPKDGDELNLVRSGNNYGWPEVSWGNHYDGKKIPDPPTRPKFTDAVKYWTPVISPSGMIIYTGSEFPEWQGNAIIGGLSSRGIVRVSINGQQAEEVGRVDLGARIRDVEQGPDGSIYVITDQDNGKILRLSSRD